jgi:CRP-like cAMP-binding protein
MGGQCRALLQKLSGLERMGHGESFGRESVFDVARSSSLIARLDATGAGAPDG